MSRITQHPVLDGVPPAEEVSFRFDGRDLRGRAGEMISSALFANNIKSFSLHHVGDAPQGIFCANGQCAQCTVVVDGRPLKSCVTPLVAGMDIRTLRHFPELPNDDLPLHGGGTREASCDVLVIGGGPSGITSAIALAKQGFSVTLVDDKDTLGGKLVLQTHKFFGSMDDCYAGTRGNDIGKILEDELRTLPNVRILTNSTVAAIYSDRRAGIFEDNRRYTLMDFQALVISPGARERSLIFPGNDLPGVFGAGAFQTLVNRDLIKASDRVFIVGCGNVGLIGAYHALQAGIQVAGIVDILDRVTGYKVHADKIKRMGVPIHLKHTVISAEGDGKVERVTIAEVDEKRNPILETAKTYEVDTLLVAVGLASADEFYDTAREYGFPVIKAGDADEIAEASSAMIGGRIAGLKMARRLGKDVVIDQAMYDKAEVLKSHPGDVHVRPEPTLNEKFQPVFHCVEEIPCNPCTSVCPHRSIHLRQEKRSIMDLPEFTGDCVGCGKCVAVCPGLAITLAKKIDDNRAEVVLPHEFLHDFKKGDEIPLTDRDGIFLENGKIVKAIFNKQYRTSLLTVAVSLTNACKIAGIRVQDEAVTQPLPKPRYDYLPENGILCRCERVSVGETIAFIKENHVRDVNQLKLGRVGMGSCGGKTCSVLLPRVFAMAGVDWKTVSQGTRRPLSVEIPMWAIVNEEEQN